MRERNFGLWVQVIQAIRGTYKPAPPAPPRPEWLSPGPGVPPQGQPGEMLELLDAARRKAGLHLLAADASLTAWAQSWARQMDVKSRMSHSNAVGASLTALGYDWFTWGENVAGPWSSGTPTTAYEAFHLWEASKPHRANMLSPDFTDVGIGYSSGYWCSTFGRRG